MCTGSPTRSTSSPSAAPDPSSQVEPPLMRPQLAVAQVKRLVVDQEADQLAVDDVDQGLSRFRHAVRRLRVGLRVRFVHAVEVAARQDVRLALVEVAAPAQVAVGQGEQRLGLGDQLRIEPRLRQAPRFDRERGLLDHGRSASSARSATTMSAPCSASCAAWRTRSTPTTSPNPPARPASTPASASSKTAAWAGSSPSARAPARNGSGAGLPRRCSRSATIPSIRTSNRSEIPAAASTSAQLALDVTTAGHSPASLTART